MKIISVIGLPGSGKSTQMARLYNSSKYHLVQIGNIIRKHPEMISKSDYQAIKEGKLIDIKLAADIVLSSLKNCNKAYAILDGFPRTGKQLTSLPKTVKIDGFIMIKTDPKTAIMRATQRKIHAPSGRIYHSVFKPEKFTGFDDVTGEPLSFRIEDREETVILRLNNSTKDLESVLKEVKNHYKLIEIDGEQEEFQVHKDLIKAINAI